MEWLFPWLLFLHVLGAIVAFGPTFAFSFIGGMGGREREHANFATRVTETITRRIVLPVALTLPVTGAGMILVGGLDLSSREFWWLGIAIALYVVALAIGVLNNLPAAKRIIDLTSPPPAASSAPPAASSGPPAELPGLIRRVQRGGMINAALIVTIVLLMVVKPQF